MLWVLLGVASAASGQDLSFDKRAKVESRLIPAVVVDKDAKAWSLKARMVRWQVPGVSIAVIDDGRIAWARGYGFADTTSRRRVTVATRFQAASISKPVAAAAAISLVDEGRLSLDRDINTVLRRWRLPASASTAAQPVTLRQLLSHTAGLTVHGFAGYAPGIPLPTLAQILDGAAPANSGPVRSEAVPGTVWRYSGGGYQIVQMAIEDTTGLPFAEIVEARVLAPAGMTHSSYALPSPGAAASGHDGRGNRIPGGVHVYPEQAAAGLWTTPTDLARFALALSAAYRGESAKLLRQSDAEQMLTPVMGGYGLGPGLAGEAATLAVSHGGSNEGFKAFWIIHPATGDGAVVMTNGDNGDRIALEILRSVAAVYDWPDYRATRVQPVTLASSVLDARVGRWRTEYDGRPVVFTVSRRSGGLSIATARGTFVFASTSPTAMTDSETGNVATFARNSAGKASLTVFGMTLLQETPVAK